ncbi:CHASE3 domain-containing protein [Bradyrhizobium betae]|uniref:histidine kinase n=1 Tax=Bradyrhizobium betae TaxID=244734 RepID=A0A5P6P9N8_9BRAD|nr:CHASE3 domain-containing protein [Bradyrhizobium betae]MCS3729292.1 PAS domain S-box-containing protein [Bradyrhizobium betae]QFI74624.1 response regulator [Bradyrhizobium betae]
MRALSKALRARGFVLVVGLTSLLVISAAAIGMDVKARADAAWVSHTLDVLKRVSDARLILRRAESAARGYALSGDDDFARDFHDDSAALPKALSELKAAVGDNETQRKLLDGLEPVLARRIALLADTVRFRQAGDSAGIAALVSRREGRAAMDEIASTFDEFTAAEQRLLEQRSARSRLSARLLLGAELMCLLMILVLAALLIRGNYLSTRALARSLSAMRAAKRTLEAEVVAHDAQIGAAREQVRQSTSVLENTFNSIAEAVLVIDTRGDVLLTNPAAQELLGYRPGMAVGDIWKVNSFCEPGTTTPLKLEDRPSTRALLGLSFDRREILIRPVNGGKPILVRVSGRPLRDTSGAISGASIVFHDITDIHETELQLQQAQKLDAVGKLTGGVAHDFNNMLTVITGTIEILKDDVRDKPDALAVAELIDQAADRCTDLIRHLLAFARKQPLRPRNVDINAAIADIAKLLRPTIGEQIQINAILDDQVEAVHIDASQLANSLVNMAINARDAMPGGGKLLLETRNIVLDEAYAQINPGVVVGPYVLVAISDTGAGMAPEVLEQAFDPFFTTKGPGKGTGLSMVYGFVKQSGGHIKIYSEAGHGTTIKLYLPPARAAEQAAGMQSQQARGGTETILVVEDDDLVRDFVIGQLRSLGYTTIGVANANEALSCIEAGISFDLLFTDVIMPGMNGQKFTVEVERLRPGTRVLYTSGYTDNAVVHNGRLDEGVLLLSKPYRKLELAQMVRVALGDSGVAGISAAAG